MLFEVNCTYINGENKTTDQTVDHVGKICGTGVCLWAEVQNGYNGGVG